MFLLFIRYQIDRCCLRKIRFQIRQEISIFPFVQQIVHSSEVSFNEKIKQSIVDTIKIGKIFNPNGPQNFVIFFLDRNRCRLVANAWYISSFCTQKKKDISKLKGKLILNIHLSVIANVSNALQLT